MKIIPKFQRGGGLESLFTVYTPPQRKQATSQQPTKSKKDDSEGKLTERDFFTMMKDIDGLPNEMLALVINTKNTFGAVGSENLATQYLDNLYKLRLAQNNKKQFDEAHKASITSGSFSEPAITADGKLMVQKKDGSIDKVSLETFAKNKDKYASVLSVSNLLNLRAYSSSFINDFSTFDTVNSSFGYQKFQNLIKEAVVTLGQSINSKEGIFGVEGQAVKGLDAIRKLSLSDQAQISGSITTEGLYKYKVIDKDQKNQINALTQYISTLLPENAKVWAALKLNTTDKESAVNSLILSYLLSKSSPSHEFEIDYKGILKDKGIPKDKEESDKEVSDEIMENTAFKWLRGLGVQSTTTINPGTNYARQIVSNTLPLTDQSKNYLGANSVLQQATSGEYSGILSWTNASMGMRKIDPTNFNRVVLTDGKITSVDFPYKVLNDNTIVPDLSPETSEAKFLADKEIRQRGIDLSDKESIRRNYQTINQIYINHKLDPAYNPDGTPAEKWMRFGVINASASNTTLGMGQFDSSSLLQEINDDAIVDNLIQITKEENFDTNNWYDYNGHDHFYRGTVWIPVNRSYIAASANVNMKTNQINDIIQKEAELNAQKMITREKK